MDQRTPTNAESTSVEKFTCGNCDRDFDARIATWVDVSRTPQTKLDILKWQFNVIECTNCGCRTMASSPFFYEDFGEGLLIAVFPRIPDDRGTVEASIQKKFGFYPVLEFFYDMAQIWALVYLLEHYKLSRSLRSLSRLGWGEERLRKILAFLKENPLMIDLRELLTESFFGDATDDELADMLNRIIAELEEMHPWPLDQRCICNADLGRSFQCCGKQIDLKDHIPHLSRRYIVYCSSCGESITGISCEICGRVYTWNRGTISSYHKEPPVLKNAAVIRESSP